MNIWQQLLSNTTLITACVAWLIAQVLKTIIDFRVYKSFNPERLVGSGGMPSSHSSTVCALAASAFLHYGPGSFEFSCVGQQCELLEQRLKEFVGHTPLQVFAGAVLGILVALAAEFLF